MLRKRRMEKEKPPKSPESEHDGGNRQSGQGSLLRKDPRWKEGKNYEGYRGKNVDRNKKQRHEGQKCCEAEWYHYYSDTRQVARGNGSCCDNDSSADGHDQSNLCLRK